VPHPLWARHCVDVGCCCALLDSFYDLPHGHLDDDIQMITGELSFTAVLRTKLVDSMESPGPGCEPDGSLKFGTREVVCITYDSSVHGSTPHNTQWYVD
jgi:hypothetical protein